LSALVEKLLDVREVAAAKVAVLDKEIRRFVRDDPTLRRFLTVPAFRRQAVKIVRETDRQPALKSHREPRIRGEKRWRTMT
jgi:hypothetical protein